MKAKVKWLTFITLSETLKQFLTIGKSLATPDYCTTNLLKVKVRNLVIYVWKGRLFVKILHQISVAVAAAEEQQCRLYGKGTLSNIAFSRCLNRRGKLDMQKRSVIRQNQAEEHYLCSM